MPEQYGSDKWEVRGRTDDEKRATAYSLDAVEPDKSHVKLCSASGTPDPTNTMKNAKEFYAGSDGYVDDAAIQTGKREDRLTLSHDFFTDPISKLFVHGRFPNKLLVNLLMLLLIFLIGILYHIPFSVANENKRKTVVDHFLGDDYMGKDKGDMVLRPTVYLSKRQDVLDHISSFVKVYYELSNTSVSEFMYYYYSYGQEDFKTLYERLPSEPSQRLKELHALLLRGDIEDNDQTSNESKIQPVTMDVNVFAFSPQELYGPSPSRHFTFTLTDTDKLGPFKKDEKLHTNKQVHGERTKAMEETHSPRRKPQRRLHNSAGGITGSSLSSHLSASQNEKNNIAAACAPRLDTISMQYYSPCRANVEKDVERFSPLLENVRSIQLRASMLHLSHSDAAIGEFDVGGFSTLLYHWSVEKNFYFNEGGLVEVTFSASVTKNGFKPKFHFHFVLSAALIVLACIDIALRIRVLARIRAWRRSITAKQRRRGGIGPKLSSREVGGASTPYSPRETLTDTRFVSPLSYGCREGISDEDDNENAKGNRSADNQPMPTTPSPFQGASLFSVTKGNLPDDTAGTFLPDRTYRDFYDIYRQQLQQSQGEGWQYLFFVTDAVIIVYSIMSMAEASGLALSESYEVFQSIFLGMSGLLVCIGLLSYLRYFPQVYFTIRATREVIPRLLTFAFTVAPFFLGFAFFFFIVFGPHSSGEFADFSSSIVGLYFIMYGDAILPAIEDAQGSVSLFVTILANAMTILFIFFFMMTMLNLAMSITQHEWLKLRRRFGACLSAGSTLFTLRTREQVKLETTQSLIANLELLLHIQYEEERMKKASDHQFKGGNDGGFEHDAEVDDNKSLDHMSRSFREYNGPDDLLCRLDELTEGAFYYDL